MSPPTLCPDHRNCVVVSKRVLHCQHSSFSTLTAFRYFLTLNEQASWRRLNHVQDTPSVQREAEHFGDFEAAKIQSTPSRSSDGTI